MGTAGIISMEDDGVDVPPEIQFDSHCMDIAMHCSQSAIATAQITGVVSVFEYGQSGNNKLMEFVHHTDSCRAVSFAEDGHTLFTGSLDMSMSMIDMATQKVGLHVTSAHSAPINSILNFDTNLMASGDDDGCVKVWDLRTKKVIHEFQESEEFISDMAYHDRIHMLLATSGDGTLGVFDIRAGKMNSVSDYMTEELLSVVILKNGSKVVCGSQDGVLCVFSTGQWADLSDRVPGHPNSVDTMIKLDEDTLVSGSSDGLIRIMQIQPNKPLGVIGDHEDFPVEKIAISYDRKLIASCSHDNTVKFWDCSFLTEDNGAEGEATMPAANRLANSTQANEDFFGDM